MHSPTYRYSLALLSSLSLVAGPLLLLGCCHVVPDQKSQLASNVMESSPLLKYRIDGSFDGWTNYAEAETATNFDWDQLQIHLPDPDISEIKVSHFYYDNDDKFLYIFFKLDRTLDQIYGKINAGFSFGCLYFDLDMNTNTGCTQHDQSGISTLPGSEVRIEILGGWFIKNGHHGRYISYEEAGWNPNTQRFDNDVRHEESLSPSPLIAFGKDGIELAIPLDTLNKTNDGRFNMAYWPELLSRDYVNWSLVNLK
jgi:hypothetical protein